MDAIELLNSRHSVRKFAPGEISDAQLREVIGAAQAAPNAHNTRPCHFLTIRNRDVLHQLVPMTPWWKLLDSCGVAVVVCVDTRVLAEKPMPEEFLIDSGAAAMENLLLAAAAIGLGGVWLGMCQGSDNYGEFCRLLNLPPWARVIGMAALGIPEAEPEMTDRFCMERWHSEVWDG